MLGINAVVESFFPLLKTKMHHHDFTNHMMVDSPSATHSSSTEAKPWSSKPVTILKHH